MPATFRLLPSVTLQGVVLTVMLRVCVWVLSHSLFSTFFALVFLAPFSYVAGTDPSLLLLLSLLMLLLVYAIPVSIIFVPKFLSILLWNKSGAAPPAGGIVVGATGGMHISTATLLSDSGSGGTNQFMPLSDSTVSLSVLPGPSGMQSQQHSLAPMPSRTPPVRSLSPPLVSSPKPHRPSVRS